MGIPDRTTCLIWSQRKAHQRLIDDAHRVLDEADPGYVAWSGGIDSTVLAHLAEAHPLVHFDSGAEFPDTRPYVTGLAERWGRQVDIIEAHPTVVETMAAAIREGHDPINATHESDVSSADHQRRRDIVHAKYGPAAILGVRCEESSARAASYRPGRGIRRLKNGRMLVAPLWRWATLDIWAYVAAHDLPAHPNYARVDALGAPDHNLRVGPMVFPGCGLVGALPWLRAGWPAEYDRLCEQLPGLREAT